MEHFGHLRINVSIVRTKYSAGGNHHVMYRQAGLRFAVYQKYYWYFDYRAALYKVNDPKHFFEVKTYRYFEKPPHIERLKKLKDDISGAKSSHTKKSNLIRLYLEDHAKRQAAQIFEIEHPKEYHLAIQKIKDLEIKVWQLELDYLDVEFDFNLDRLLDDPEFINQAKD